MNVFSVIRASQLTQTVYTNFFLKLFLIYLLTTFALCTLSFWNAGGNLNGQGSGKKKLYGKVVEIREWITRFNGTDGTEAGDPVTIPGSVRVQWLVSKQVNVYRYGAENKYDVRWKMLKNVQSWDLSVLVFGYNLHTVLELFER